MLRQASSRNQRSKGFKVKHALQICLLVAISIWLLYQVKHSHDKKSALIERSSNILRSNVDKKEDFFKFGRKFLPQTEETHKGVENDETQEEEIEEDRDAKQEETIPEIEDKEAKNDNIDEHDQEKGDEEEMEHLFESTEEEQNHNNDKSNNEDEENEHGEVDVFDKQEREGSTQEAREENYKRDDASSAVAHDDHATESETGALNIDEENANASKGVNDTKIDGVNTEILEKKVLKPENVTNGTDEGTKNDGIQEISGGIIDTSTNATSETNVDSTNKLDDLVNKMSVNETVHTNDSYHNNTSVENKDDKGTRSTSTIVEYKSEQQADSMYQVEVHNNSTTSNATMLNDVSMDSTQIQGISNDSRTSNKDNVSLQSLHNITDVSANNTTAGDDKILSLSVIENSGNNSTIAVDEQKSNNTTDPNENKNATTLTVNEFRNSTLGNSDNSAHVGITEEERDSRIDLSTLPVIQTEVAMASADEAAE